MLGVQANGKQLRFLRKARAEERVEKRPLD